MAVAAANETFDFGTFSGYFEFASAFLREDSRVVINEGNSNSLFEEVEFRYGAPSLFAVGFHRLASRGEFALFNPIINSFYSFLPRQVFSDKKPFPSSSDGTEKSMGMYKCITEVTGNDASMTDFYVGSHYYWEFGWFGLVFLSIVPAFFNAFVILFFKNWSYLGAAIFLLSLKPFWFIGKLWISEIITMIPTLMIPAVSLILVLRSFYRFRFVSNL